MRVRVRTIRWESERVNAYLLEPLAGEHLPAFAAGAHIDVKLADGLSRSYSLMNDPAERDRYEIGVQHAPDSRGGSRHLHQTWRPGQVVEIAEPSNNFSTERVSSTKRDDRRRDRGYSDVVDDRAVRDAGAVVGAALRRKSAGRRGVPRPTGALFERHPDLR